MRNKLYSILLLLNCVACQQDISATLTNEYRDNHVVQLSFEVSDKSSLLTEPTITLFPKYNASNIVDSSNIEVSNDGPVYRVTMNNLNDNDYRLKVILNYQDSFFGIDIGQASTTKYFDFTVHKLLAHHCFRFDDAENKYEAWKTSPVYIDNRDKPISPASCPGLFHINQSWPPGSEQAQNHGSLFVPISNDCFPTSSSLPSANQYWQFSFISPDLVNNKNWKNIKGYQFRVRTEDVPILVTPELRYNNKGIEKLISGKQQVLSPGKWHIVNLNLKDVIEGSINNVSIRINGKPELTVLKKVDSVLVDGVCPIY